METNVFLGCYLDFGSKANLDKAIEIMAKNLKAYVEKGNAFAIKNFSGFLSEKDDILDAIHFVQNGIGNEYSKTIKLIKTNKLTAGDWVTVLDIAPISIENEIYAAENGEYKDFIEFTCACYPNTVLRFGVVMELIE